MGVNIATCRITGPKKTGRLAAGSSVAVNVAVVVSVTVGGSVSVSVGVSMTSVTVTPTGVGSSSQGRLQDKTAKANTRIDKPRAILHFITSSWT